MALAGLLIAAMAVIATVLVEQTNRRHEREAHLDAVWQQVMATVDDFPALSDVSQTRNYLKEFSWNERLRYDAFCLRAWSACFQLVRQRRKPYIHQQVAIEWMATYHHEWLVGNAQLFNDARFWRRIDQIRSREPLITIHRPVPSDSGGLVEWSSLLERYFDTFISPFDPSIPEPERIEGHIRGVLAQAVRATGVVVDLGCGVGNAFPTLAASAFMPVGIDLNLTALKIAASATGAQDVRRVAGDHRRLPLRSGSADVIISINSILAETRSDERDAFAEMERVLRPGGAALLLLPAFEAITHVRELRVEAAALTGGRAHAARVRRAFDQLRMVDEDSASYADDGTTRQYFHSLSTISEAVGSADLELSAEPVRFRYPWSLTREFNYGFFPGKPETWDWLVFVRKPLRSGAE